MIRRHPPSGSKRLAAITPNGDVGVADIDADQHRVTSFALPAATARLEGDDHGDVVNEIADTNARERQRDTRRRLIHR
jgi:hypothetical protein